MLVDEYYAYSGLLSVLRFSVFSLFEVPLMIVFRIYGVGSCWALGRGHSLGEGEFLISKFHFSEKLCMLVLRAREMPSPHTLRSHYGNGHHRIPIRR